LSEGTLAGSYTLSYDIENRLTEVKKDSVTLMKFVYDGDGKRVKSEAYTNGVLTETIHFVGAHCEVTNPGSGQSVTKYYFMGSQRIATLAPHSQRASGLRAFGAVQV
jgi:YD repeat-containing protein